MLECGATVQLTRLVSRIVAPNPGPMTLDGTNTYIVRAQPGAAAIVIDPGPELATHLDQICAAGPVGLILVTHEHDDHTAASAALHARTGAPVRGISSQWCIAAEPLADQEILELEGVSVVAHHTPGHTSDSACFEILGDAACEAPGVAATSVCTGDTLLGHGTTIVPYPEGSLTQYLASLERISGFDSVLMLPGHGAAQANLQQRAEEMIAHRLTRLQQVQELLQLSGEQPDPDDDVLVGRITAELYSRVVPAAQFAAISTVRAQLDYLRTQAG